MRKGVASRPRLWFRLSGCDGGCHGLAEPLLRHPASGGNIARHRWNVDRGADTGSVKRSYRAEAALTWATIQSVSAGNAARYLASRT